MLSEFNDVNFGVKTLAALMAYREYALGRRSAYGTAAWHWLEVGRSTWLLYHTPKTAHDKAKGAGVVRPAAVEELAAETLRRLFLKPSADHYSHFIEELTKGGKMALMFDRETESSYVFKLFRIEVGGLKELGIKLRIVKVGEGITYALEFDDVEKWRGFFGQELEAEMKAAGEVGGSLTVKDRLPYMLGWVDSDVAITRNKKGERVLLMTTSHLWQLTETRALFGWSVVGLRMTLTLEGPKLAVIVDAPSTGLTRRSEKARRAGGSRCWASMQRAGMG